MWGTPKTEAEIEALYSLTYSLDPRFAIAERKQYETAPEHVLRRWLTEADNLCEEGTVGVLKYWIQKRFGTA